MSTWYIPEGRQNPTAGIHLSIKFTLCIACAIFNVFSIGPLVFTIVIWDNTVEGGVPHTCQAI